MIGTLARFLSGLLMFGGLALALTAWVLGW